MQRWSRRGEKSHQRPKKSEKGAVQQHPYQFPDGPDLRRQLHRQSTPGGSGLKRAELAQGIGRSRGGRGSKVHAAVDQSGRPLRFEITGAQTHDSKAFGTLTGWQKPPAAIVADKAYGSNAIRQAIANEGAIAVIPSKSNARHPIAHDPDIYAQRNLVERFFCRMKDMRRLTTPLRKTQTKLHVHDPHLRNQMLAELSPDPNFRSGCSGAGKADRKRHGSGYKPRKSAQVRGREEGARAAKARPLGQGRRTWRQYRRSPASLGP